jgi:uncharacterized protein (TIGR02300 family)
MGSPELGTKCTCTGCGGRFYTLNRVPNVCPRCGVEQPPEKPRAVRPSRSSFGSRRSEQQSERAFVEAEPAAADEAEDDAETEDADAAPDPDDEADDDDAGIDPGLGKVA